MVDNLLDCSLGGLVFATIGGTFDSILILTMPIDRSAIVQVQGAGTRSPRSHVVGHEIGVDERGEKNRISFRSRRIMRNSLRAIAVLSSPIPIDNLEARAVGKIDVELDSRILATPRDRGGPPHLP